ncbi:TPA: alpha/beta hydrolase [Candidatus Saccharibacteria bacterium]|nr:alpha/beta hydrolase [Candidatus Saccharibacteria bacterium]
MNWYDGKPLEEKMARVKKILEKMDGPVAIIGESAGATVALLAAAEYKNVHTLITICGVAQPTTPISPYLQHRAPALPEAVKRLDSLSFASSLSIHSLRSWYDPVVGKKYSVAPAATVHTLLVPGHLFTILCCLTVLSWYVIRLVRDKEHLLPL